MRRFSQRNSLVTLSDINITPLLDLAFVLLIIFIITTPLLEKGLDLQLPSAAGAQDSKRLDKKDIRTVEVSPQGYYVLDSRPMKLPQIAQRLAADFRANPNLLVFIRADKNARVEFLTDILDQCRQIGITRFSVRTDPRPRAS
jgi:biopolymer transport protein ExbD